MLKRIGLLLLLLILTITAIIAYQWHRPLAPVSSDETLRADEPAQAQRAIDNFLAIIKQHQSLYTTRGAHAKSHACVKAYFTVQQNLVPNLQHGVFIPGQQYKSWIRFSNGSPNADKHDGQKDSRGMAVKLLQVDEGNASIQSFLMHNSPAFFSRDIEDYNQLVESEDKLRYFVQGANPFNWRIRQLKHAIDTLAPAAYSPLWDQYFSNTAYKLGPHNIKFRAIACTGAIQSPAVDESDPNFLRNRIVSELAMSEACFNFQIQQQDTEQYMPIEDPSVLWKETEAPFQTIATITIPAQQFNNEQQRQSCENMTFSPWQTLAAHKPIGELNRIRKLVYTASAAYRHQQNKTAETSDLDW